MYDGDGFESIKVGVRRSFRLRRYYANPWAPRCHSLRNSSPTPVSEGTPEDPDRAAQVTD
jgi:hypothetical protein